MKRQIVFVDDDAFVLQGLRRLLRRQKDVWQMKFFENGEEATQYLAENPAEIICSDLRMPKMNGVQVLSKAQSLCPNALRIVLSGQADDDSIFRIVSPAHFCLSKPCSQPELIDTIHRALELKDFINEPLDNESFFAITEEHPELESSLQVANQAEPAIKCLQNEVESNDILRSFFEFANNENVFDFEELKATLSPQRMRRFFLAVCTFLMFRRSADCNKEVATLLKRGLIASDISSRIAHQELDDPNTIDVAETAGLFLELGKLVELTSSQLELSEVEQSELRNKIAASILLRMGFPLGIGESVAYQSRQSSNGQAKGLSETQMIQFASRFLNQNAMIHDSDSSGLESHVLEQWQLTKNQEAAS